MAIINDDCSDITSDLEINETQLLLAEEEKGALDTGGGWKEEAKMMFKLGGSVSAIQFGRVAMNLTDVAMLGHLDSEYLAAAATGTIWMNLTMFVVYRSLVTVLKNLSSAAVGAKNPLQAGVWLQVALLLGVILTAIISSLWVISEPLFEHVFGMSSPDAHRAALYVRYSAIWVPPQVTFLIFNNFFQSLHIINPAVVTTYIFVPINAALNLFLIWGIPGTSFSGLGFVGSPLATSITRWTQCICYSWYMFRYRKAHETIWGGWTKEALSDERLGKFLKIGVPLALSGFFEEAQLQAVSIMAVHLGSDEISAHATVINIFLCLTAFVMGLRTAVNLRISYYFGKGDAIQARLMTKMGLIGAVILGLFVMAITLSTRSFIGRLFTSDHHVQSLIKELLLLMSISYIFMAIFLVITIILMSAHKTKLVALIFFAGGWFVGVPMAFVFAFPVDQGVEGLWEGLIAGYSLMLCAGGVATWRIDYEETAAAIHSVVRKKEIEREDE
eukprot:TRINITY_DN23237_c0_g1_i1.p1 TRINITY_DN23237_c0_g1~~TRINITY_DN23237_c0_g1_i1.p1  ORF type:complete len:501 (+),score=78.45 TRINITY_DN23237_c0_g1_i1:42-1544(+)